MSDKFPKKYELNIESEIYKSWQENDFFNPETVRKSKKNLNEKEDSSFMISMPPPNVT